ncbi:serine hydrolase domain-containing protein [Rhodohalobacter mucosus]|uniref:Serine hydrolase n=1 Tax=Rhodohalobacter mucosus TaxID=2079485 RepID=A0A316TNY4_9BACT|nr:serine hydrolase domain-containing protein [Rhodohalobacter mucosus]PWN06323.1 serine hydrolase [Rhodohalobacter mucosus]
MSDKKNIKNSIRAALALGTIISLYFVPWTLLWAWITPLPDTVQEQVENATDLGFDGIIVYVNQGGKEPASYAAGWHNSEQMIPADPQALFKIASIRKLYDAVAITKLIHDNRLSLDDTVAETFPGLQGRIENADVITLRMLVQHRSGIPNVTDTPNFWTDPPETNEEALERVLDLPADFEPDTDYSYSNTNYVILTELIEQVTGMSKFQFIKEEILNPLGLNNTFGSLQEVDINRLMSGYYVGVEEDIKTADYGSMIATAEDVGIFLRALNDGSLFEEGEQEIYSSIYAYDHTGLIPGYQSIAKYHRDIDTVVIQFTNTTDFEGYNWSLSEILYDRIVSILKRQ